MTKSNMYDDAIYRWNVFVGCEFDCIYCRKSFQAQMKRQKHMIDKNGRERGCQECYDYTPHFHYDRLSKKYMDTHFPQTEGDQFIWIGSSGDISFIDKSEMLLILMAIRKYPDRTFFFQTKNPMCFQEWEFPDNVILGITLESNRHYPTISKASAPWVRFRAFSIINHLRKSVTIEPILKFDFINLYGWILELYPERVYIGYDSKKNNLPEPPLKEVRKLITNLKRLTKVKEKLMRKAWDE